MIKAPKEVLAMATYDAALLVAGGDVAIAVETLVMAIVHASLQTPSPARALASIAAHLDEVRSGMAAEAAPDESKMS